MKQVLLINPADKYVWKNRYLLAFGAYGETILMVWAKGIDSALDECVDWIADHKPGLLANESVQEEYKSLIAQGVAEEQAQEQAAMDTTCAGNNGHYLNSCEWTILDENPSNGFLKRMSQEGYSFKLAG